MSVSDEQALQPVRASRMFTVIIEKLIDYIDRNGLKAGDRLPNEGEIASMLGVSRPTLRQAFRVLETSAVLTIRSGQNGGVFVRSDMIPVDLLAGGVAEEVDSMESLLITRHLVEPIVVHLAAENATADELEGIAYAIEVMDKHRTSSEMIVRADGMYHRRVALASHDEILRSAITSLYRRLLPLRSAMGSQRALSADHMIDVHSRQLAAIRARDHDLIDELLRETFADLEDDVALDFPYEVRWHRRS